MTVAEAVTNLVFARVSSLKVSTFVRFSIVLHVPQKTKRCTFWYQCLWVGKCIYIAHFL